MSDSSDVEKTNYTADEKGYQTGGSDIVVEDHGADCELQRRLSTRHITMIALGSSIGMGLWLGSGTSLASGGPASIFIGYLLSGTMIWSVSHSIGESTLYRRAKGQLETCGSHVESYND
jgi:amino acid transporter